MTNNEAIKHSRFNEWISNYKQRNQIKFDNEIAENLDTSEQTISKLINGRQFLSKKMANKINRLDPSYSVDYLLGNVKSRNMLEEDSNRIQLATEKIKMLKFFLSRNGLHTEYDKLTNYYIGISDCKSVNIYRNNSTDIVSIIDIDKLEKALSLSETVFLSMIDIE